MDTIPSILALNPFCFSNCRFAGLKGKYRAIGDRWMGAWSICAEFNRLSLT